MSTYREIQDRICLDYLNRSTLYSETKRAIRAAIRTYEARRFFFNETATALATVAGQSYFDVPTDMLSFDSLEISYAGSTTELIHTSFKTIRNMNAVSATAVPTHFAYRGDRFEVALIPDSAYAVTCYYLQNLPALSADTDTNAWTTEAENLIVHAATIDILTGVLHVEDDKRIQRHVAQLSQAIQELTARQALRMPLKLKGSD